MSSIAAALLPWFQSLQDQPLSTAWRESLLGYPIIETAHVVSIVMFAGFVVMMDLRLVGLVFTRVPFSYLQRRLFPWQMVGMGLSALTGTLLFCIDPMRFYGNVFFWMKMAMLLLAGVNAVAFHFTTYKAVARWDEASRTPTAARVAGTVSLTLWALIIVSGRLIAYNWFK
jgi:hypothetical protein